MACQICKNETIKDSIKVRDFEYDRNLFATYYTCGFCSTIYRNKLKKNTIEKLYTKSYLPISGSLFYDFLKKINAQYEWHIIRKIIKNTFCEKKKIKILDLGCGKGFLLRLIAKTRKYKCHGFDINQKTEKNKNISFYKKSFNDFKAIKKIDPDIIILNNFIEHIEDLSDFKKLVECLNINTYIIILTPNSNTLSCYTFGSYWSGYHSPRHANIFNKKSFAVFLKCNNLTASIRVMLDPLSLLVSLKNFLSDIKTKFTFYKLFLGLKIFTLVIFNLFAKTRLIVVCNKKK